MFDTMTMTKVVGGFCGSLLVFLLGGWFAEIVRGDGGAHGEGHQQAYVIPVESAEPAAEEEAVPFEELLAMADISAGPGLFRACQSCHSLEPGQNGTGPSLYGVVGRPIGAEPGFSYSTGFADLAEAWTPEELDAFLTRPSAYAPRTAMSYNGMRDPQDRANLIAWLDSLDG